MFTTLTADNVLDFYASRSGLLCLDGTSYVHLDVSDIDGRAESYAFVDTYDGREVQVLLDRETIAAGDWFPLDEDGTLSGKSAAEMAEVINSDAGLTIAAAIAEAHGMGEQAQLDAERAQQSAMRRASAVVRVVELCGGNQSEAARCLGLDQSTVNKLVRKAAESPTS